MVNFPFSPETPLPFAERYARIDKLRDDDLGELYLVIQKNSTNELWALKLYSWVGDLPEPLRTRLHAALNALGQSPSRDLLSIRWAYVDETRLDSNGYPIDYNCIEFDKPEGLLLDQWPLSAARSPRDAASIIIKLVHALIALQQQASENQELAWLRPVIKAEKILLLGIPETLPDGRYSSMATLRPLFMDPGFATLLMAQEPDQNSLQQIAQIDQPETIKAVARLLFQLLRDPEQFQAPLSASQELRQTQTEILKEVTANDRPGLNTIFGKAFSADQPSGYRNLTEFAEDLLAWARKLQVLPAPDQKQAATPPSTTQRSVQGQRVDQPERTSHDSQASGATKIDHLDVEDRRKSATTSSIASYPLFKNRRIILGSGGHDDIPLPDMEVGRRLVIVHQNGQFTERYVIADTSVGPPNPNNLAYLDGIPISPFFAALFDEHSHIEVNDYQLRLRRGGESTQLFSRRARPLQLLQNRFVGNPGSVIPVEATIQNITNEVDSFWIAVDGAPDAMQIELPAPREYYTNEMAPLQFIVRLPPLSMSLAGDYQLILRLISENYRVQIAAVQITITILPEYDFLAVLAPEILRVGNDGEVIVENHGNVTRLFRLQWRDRAQELDFVPADATVTVPPLSSITVGYRAYIRGNKRRLLGGKQLHNTTVAIAPQGGGAAQSVAGQVVSRALIPGWLPTVLLLLLLLFLFAATFIFQPEIAHPATVAYAESESGTTTITTTFQPTLIAVVTPRAETPFVVRWQPLGSCFYSVYENGTITEGPTFIGFSDKETIYKPRNLGEGTTIEVRLRSCLLVNERRWDMEIAAPSEVTPTVTPTVLPEFVVAQSAVKYHEQQAFLSAGTPVSTAADGVTRLLIGQTGDFCLTWQITGPSETLTITPTLPFNLSGPIGELCAPINELFQEPVEVARNYFLEASYGMETVRSTPIARVEVLAPICRVNIDESRALYLAIREGPGQDFAERGGLRYDERVVALSRPFRPLEQTEEGLEWILIALPDDPRPAWVAYRETRALPDGPVEINQYLVCPLDLRVMPNADVIPPTPTQTPTPTATATPSPTPEAAFEISLEPAIINPDGCALLKWKIENVKEVYINEEGVVGEGERESCPAGPGQYPYEWRIVKPDGSIVKVTKTLTVNPGPGGLPSVPTPPE